MSAEVIPFDFEDQPVRALLREGQTWWVAADVCRVLEIGNPRDAVSRLDDDERDNVGSADVNGRGRPVHIINESGLYALILTSRKPAARRFRKWVTAEVLPQLRREGQYVLRSKAARREIGTDRLIELLEAENTLLRQQAGKRRSRHSTVPVSDEEKAQIRDLIDEGKSLAEISRRTGRSRSFISLFRSGMRVVDGGADCPENP